MNCRVSIIENPEWFFILALVGTNFLKTEEQGDERDEHKRIDILPALKDGDSSSHKEGLPASQKSLANRDDCPSVQWWLSPQA